MQGAWGAAGYLYDQDNYSVTLVDDHIVRIAAPVYNQYGSDTWIINGNLKMSVNGGEATYVLFWKAADTSISSASTSLPCYFSTTADGYFDITLGNSTNHFQLTKSNNGNQTLTRNGDGETFSFVAEWVLPFSLLGKQLTFSWDVVCADYGSVTLNSVTVTPENPYTISSADDWNAFAANVNSGTNNYSGKYVQLTADIAVSEMVGTSESNSFQGTFLGDGKTLTFTKGSSETAFGESRCAPFRYVKDATIQDLNVVGDIYTSNWYAAGLIAQSFGTTSVTNCHVSAVIYSSKNGSGDHGGIVAITSGRLSIEGCIYTGRLLTNNSTNNCGGFVGMPYQNPTISVANSLYAPTGSIPEGWEAINDGATFVRTGSPTITNCFYTEPMGDVQGTQKELTTVVNDGVYSVFTATSGTGGVTGGYFWLVDGYTGTKMCVTTGNPTFVEFYSSMPITPTGYIMTTAGDAASYPGRNPKDWTIKAKVNADDANWTTLTTVTGDTRLPAANRTATAYPITNTTAYQYFRLEVSAVKSGDMFQLDEFQFMETTKDVAFASVTGVDKSYLFDGTGISITPALTSTDTTPLTLGTDYTATLNGAEVTSYPISISATGVNTFTFTGKGSYTGSQDVTFHVVDKLSGSGNAADDPVLISSASQWVSFAKLINLGVENYSDKFVRLTQDISVTEMVGADETNSFQGTFDGGGHTLTFTQGSSESAFGEENCAPFRNVKNANIHDLNVVGDIYTSQKFAAGLASRTYGTTNITDCVVGTNIYSSVSSSDNDGTHGGIVAMPSGPLSIEGCIYTGRLLTNNSTNKCGGFVGWHNSTAISVASSVYAPTGDIPEGWSAINDGSTFVRGGSPTITDCVYSETMGSAQGVRFNTALFAQMLASSNTGGEQFTRGDVNGDGVVDIADATSLTNYLHTNQSDQSDTGSQSSQIVGFGTEESPYIIDSADAWNTLAMNVNQGTENYSEKFVRLDADISVREMVGAGETNSFQGTFDGGGHRLTFTLGSAETAFGEQYCAPFRYVKDATIQNLKVDGDIYTSRKFAAGLASRTCGTTNITNCMVGTNIYSSVSSNDNDGTHGGIVAFASEGLSIESCIYTGRLLTNNSTNKCGGFVGWNNNTTISVANSVYAPTGNIPEGWEAINDGSTFVRGGSPTITGSVYSEPMGGAQGARFNTALFAQMLASSNTGGEQFTRGDVNGDGVVDIADATSLTNYLHTDLFDLQARTLSFDGNVTSVDKRYDDAAFTIPAIPSAGAGDGRLTYSSSNIGVATVNSMTGKVTIVGVGTTTITASVTAGSYYTTAEASYTLTVSKVAATKTNPTAKTNLKYNGSAQALATAGMSSHGTYTYCASQDGTYTSDIPTAMAVGDGYTVYWKFTGDSNHTDDSGSLTGISIAKGDGAVTLSATNILFGTSEAKNSTRQVTFSDNTGTLTASGDDNCSVSVNGNTITITRLKNNWFNGKVTVTIAETGNYTSTTKTINVNADCLVESVTMGDYPCAKLYTSDTGGYYIMCSNYENYVELWEAERYSVDAGGNTFNSGNKTAWQDIMGACGGVGFGCINQRCSGVTGWYNFNVRIYWTNERLHSSNYGHSFYETFWQENEESHTFGVRLISRF